MADFTQNATLSAPQGAGSTPISPIQKVDNTKALTSGFSNIFESIGGYQKAETDRLKQEAAARKETVIRSYVRDENVFAQMLESGQISAAQAASRSRANFRTYSSNFGEYIEDLEKASRALKGNTEMSEAQKELEAERNQYIADKSEASKAGYLFPPGMSKDAEMAQIKAHKTGIVEAAQLKQRREAAAEARAQGTYDATLDAKQEKEASFQAINNIAGSHLEAYRHFVTSNADAVKSGKMSPDQARALNLERYTNITAGLQASARMNPELAAPFRSLFDEIYKTGDKLSDPKTATEDLRNQLTLLTTKAKLTAMADPEVKAAIVAYDLFPNSPTVTLGTSKEAMRAIQLMASDPKDGKFVPQVVGDPKIEGETLDFLKAAVRDVPTKGSEQQKKAYEQASNSVNNLLKQTGKFIDEGVDPKKLTKLAEFYASPEYAVLVNNGKIDPTAAQTAKKVFQITYEKTLIKGVNDKLQGRLFGKEGDAQPNPIAVKDTIDVKFTGSGVTFVAKPLWEVYGTNQAPPSDIERRRQKEIVAELNTAQKAVNQLIHIGAHMEGTINYAKYWEENKHILVPSLFTAPEKPATARSAPVPAAPKPAATKSWWEE